MIGFVSLDHCWLEVCWSDDRNGRHQIQNPLRSELFKWISDTSQVQICWFEIRLHQLKPDTETLILSLTFDCWRASCSCQNGESSGKTHALEITREMEYLQDEPELNHQRVHMEFCRFSVSSLKSLNMFFLNKNKTWHAFDASLRLQLVTNTGSKKRLSKL